MVSIVSGFAFPLKNNIAGPSKNQTIIPNFNFHATVNMDDGCSGAIIKLPGQPEDSPAWLLTNGHCVKFMRMIPPNTAVYNRDPFKRRIIIYKDSYKLEAIFAKTTKILYATMTGTDFAIFEVNKTYKELAQQNITPFLLSSFRPFVGLPIQIISGRKKLVYHCSIDAFIYQLKEDQWTFTDSIRYSARGCHIIPGTSGSPILALGGRIVVGVNNTTNHDGERCTMHNPCEVDHEGNIDFEQARSYGQQTYLIYDCLSVDFKIDLNRPGCRLFKKKLI